MDFQPTVHLDHGKYVTTCCRRRIREERDCPNCGRPILPLTWDARKAHADHVAQIAANVRGVADWLKERVASRGAGGGR